ncbi:hypothetical protein IGI04_005702 [Brassica rapa subsp. trilocularis]|uniref:Uncharacterized protein n=1 Tax=Brassica rapa subsp. trilocularis TaxID=1813537 RepID=A0ABQ7NEQ7_BRACM|nr:hypothetical protein IGI04_005702 [Brassica rapa subsp. trilocularis]
MGLESCFSGKHGLSLLRSSGDSIRRFDENARTGVVSMFGKVQSLHSDRTLARARSLCSDRAKRVLGRYVATELWLELGRYAATERDDRSVATDRAGRTLGRYVATELWLELGRYRRAGRTRSVAYVATELWLEARSLRSDRAGRSLGRYVATEAWRSSVARLASRAGRTLGSLRSDRSAQRSERDSGARSLRLTYEPSGRLRSGFPSLGRYVATELWLELGRCVATERDDRSVATSTTAELGRRSDRALARARSLRSDRAGRLLGRYVATELS